MEDVQAPPQPGTPEQAGRMLPLGAFGSYLLLGGIFCVLATFGFGFLASFLPQSAILTPRLGAGYAMLWMHVAAGGANAPNVERSSEDLVAPGVYGTFATSVRVTRSFRIVGEAVGMATTHEMVVRIAGVPAARWGGLIGALALRGEWVIAP